MQCLAFALFNGVWFQGVNELTEFEYEQMAVIDYYAKHGNQMNDEQLYTLADLQAF